MLGFLSKIVMLVLLAISPFALASQESRPPEEVGRELVLCIESNFFDGCWGKILKKNFDYRQPDPDKAIEVMEKNFKDWIGSKEVFKVHRGPVEKSAGIFEGIHVCCRA